MNDYVTRIPSAMNASVQECQNQGFSLTGDAVKAEVGVEFSELKKRGRKKMTEQEKIEAKKKRDEKKQAQEKIDEAE